MTATPVSISEDLPVPIIYRKADVGSLMTTSTWTDFFGDVTHRKRNLWTATMTLLKYITCCGWRRAVVSQLLADVTVTTLWPCGEMLRIFRIESASFSISSVCWLMRSVKSRAVVRAVDSAVLAVKKLKNKPTVNLTTLHAIDQYVCSPCEPCEISN